jgi:tricorn protease-like protein
MAALASGMTLRQVHELQVVGEVATSPDGRHIAYTRVVPRQLFKEADGPAWTELHIVDAEGPEQGFRHRAGERRLAWLDPRTAAA